MKTKHSGKIKGAKESGVNAEDGAAAASAALKAAGEVSLTDLSTVREALTKIAHGVEVLAKEPEAALFSNN